MVYVSIGQIVRVHFLMGVCFAIGFAAYARYRSHPRTWFAFGGDTFSLGEAQRWLRWYVVAFGFEILTSLAPGHTLYVELSLSFVEAAALVTGAFIVDRLVMVFLEVEPPARPSGTRSTLRDRLKRAQTTKSDAQAERRAKDREAFNNATRNH